MFALEYPPGLRVTRSRPLPLRRRIQIAREVGDHEAALALLAEARTAQPDATWPDIEAIAIAREQGDREAVHRLVEAALARDPKQGRVWLQLGLLARLEGRHEAALAAFVEARALEPTAFEPVLQMAQETFLLGRTTESEILLREAMALDTTSGQTTTLAAQRAMMADDPAGALAFYEAAMARNPTQPQAYVGACNALVRLGRLAEAEARIQQGLAACGSRPGLHARKANLLRDMGYYAEAALVAETALTAHPKSFALWEIAMRLRIMTGEPESMREFAPRAHCARDTERAAYCAMLGDMEAALGNEMAAMVHYRDGLAIAPNLARLYGAMAVTSLTRFDITEAFAQICAQTRLLAPGLILGNRSDNPTQSYYGQIINDYRVEPEVAQELANLPAASSARLEVASGLVRRFPGSTAAAASVLDVLCRGDAFATVPTEQATIPRQIAQFWDMPAPPADIARLMASWAAQNDGFAHRVFDDLAARAFLAKHHSPDVLAAYHMAVAPAMKADLFRLAFLVTEGGVYADADDRCVAPVSQLLPPGKTLVLYREYLGTAGNNFMAAASGEPVLRAALARATAAILRGDQDMLWLATGPGLITRCLAAEAADPTTRQALLARTQVWDRRILLRCVGVHCLADYKESEQHWLHATFKATRAA